MECIKCKNNVVLLCNVYRLYGDEMTCKDCAPPLIRCKCNKVISINSIHNHHKSKVHTNYIVNRLKDLGFQ